MRTRLSVYREFFMLCYTAIQLSSDTHQAYFIGTCAATPWLTVSHVEKMWEQKHFFCLALTLL